MECLEACHGRTIQQLSVCKHLGLLEVNEFGLGVGLELVGGCRSTGFTSSRLLLNPGLLSPTSTLALTVVSTLVLSIATTNRAFRIGRLAILFLFVAT